MQRKWIILSLVAIVLLGSTAVTLGGWQPAAASPLNLEPTAPLVVQGSGFTYQGKLLQGSNPATGNYDLRFTLYDAAGGGNVVGGPITLTNQTTQNGLFTAQLDFGNTAFNGQARWLEVALRPTGNGNFALLTPRQPLANVPYAQSVPWLTTSGKPYPHAPERRSDELEVVSNGVFGGSSITIGSDGLPILSYPAGPNSDLTVAHCKDVSCSISDTHTFTSSTDDTAITIRPGGLPIISYFALNSFDLKVASCRDIMCSTADIYTLDTTGDTGRSSSITIGSDGYVIISYQGANNDLKVAHCVTSSCSTANTYTLDSADAVGFYTSITIGADGLAIISYYDDTNDDLKIAHCDNVACSSADVSALITGGITGQYSSITIGADGLPVVSFYNLTNRDLWLARCSDPACNSGNGTSVDTVGDVGQSTSVVIGPDNLPLISYQDVTNGALKLALCHDKACNTATLSTLDGYEETGRYTTITIGADGLPVMSYNDPGGQLRVFRCASLSCNSYQRRNR